MKSTFRTMAIAACFALVSLTSCYFPGSDQYKIKSATKEYVKSQLGEGEKFRYGYLERKCGRNIAIPYWISRRRETRSGPIKNLFRQKR